MIKKKTYQDGYTHSLLIKCENSPLCGGVCHMLCIFSSRITKGPFKYGEEKLHFVLLNFFTFIYS